ncbi:type II toxin-antitoxin system HicB family antitoxin [Candidatus Sumerlaeota bacterium]|nr:type II toxin-antitoxin system HicB family antitoxin [Candidatus Sumerlaeota bacterium]
MKSYIFPIVVDPDETRWRAHAPGFVEKGAATWVNTRDEAMRNMPEVAQMVIETLLEDGKELPAAIRISEQTMIAVTI